MRRTSEGVGRELVLVRVYHGGQVLPRAAIERFTGHRFGSSGSLTAVRIITEVVRSVPARQVGYSGLMVPVLEDRRLAQRWSEGAIDIDSLLSYSAVCATGLDTLPLPGDVSQEQLRRIPGDVAGRPSRTTG